MHKGDRGRADAHHQPETDTAASDFPMSDIEMELTEQRGKAGILGHISGLTKPAGRL